MNTEAKPFLKWAGGKGQLLEQLASFLPALIHNEQFTYIEPFVGGGAMLFFMLRNYPNMRQVVINDVNEDLISTYRIIWKSRACLTPEDKAMLTPENFFILTPLKS